ncbi:MAG: TatD family hydrolase [Thermoplasmata archaeon]
MSQLAGELKGLPITDHHVHLRPSGRGLEAVQEFARAGGTRILLVHVPYEDLPARRPEDFAASYGRTLRMAERVRALGLVEVLVALGPHPAELVPLQGRAGLGRGLEIMRAALEIAQAHVMDGQADAIGEIGRPHWPVDEDLWARSNQLMEYGVELAHDAGCPVILHTESPSPQLFEDLASMADQVGLSRGRVVKHYADASILPRENLGIFPSVIAKGDHTREAASKGTRFLLETDYLDDPRRPGAVLGPSTIPKRTAALLREERVTREDVRRIHEENIVALYGARS